MTSICFQCPECHAWTTTDRSAASAWTCVSCSNVVPAAAPTDDLALTACHRCGNHELYIQKAFPHWLGMSIIALASLGFFIAMWHYWIATAWFILIGCAAVDVLLYFTMGSMTVCYRCSTRYRGFSANSSHAPFDLAIGEKYRQERFRRQQLRES